jgi:hypothetical protein
MGIGLLVENLILQKCAIAMNLTSGHHWLVAGLQAINLMDSCCVLWPTDELMTSETARSNEQTAGTPADATPGPSDAGRGELGGSCRPIVFLVRA